MAGNSIMENDFWYIADILVESKIKGSDRNIVETNAILINAASDEEAYEKTLKLGDDYDDCYVNPNDETVIVKFRGIRQLAKIDGTLAHGTELFFEEKENVLESEINQLLRNREELTLFMKNEQKIKMDFVAKDVYEEFVKRTKK